ncbi:unnamed protein product [Auanema sp. JU1783]|nr:unnamed protein product [Auanema sp. JU1783]
MVHYKLNYFNGRGAAEVIRLIFKYAEKDFEDNRINRDDWPALKEGFSPFGQLPVLEVDGKKLPQSFTIARYLAKQFGIAGKNAWDEAVVDSYADQYKDMMVAVTPFFRISFGMLQGDLEKERVENLEPAVKKNFEIFTEALKKNPSGFFVGDSLTWVDILIASGYSLLSAHTSIATDYPTVKAHAEKINSIPQIKAWIESRPDTPF